MDFEDRLPIGHTQVSDEGYMLAMSRVARTGIQLYRGAELGRPDMPVVRVYRPESAVFAKDSMASFAGKPVTLLHPKENVTAENWKDLAVGNVLQGVARDGEFIVVPFQLMHKPAIQKVQDGMSEISMGYSTDIKWEAGIADDGSAYDAMQTGPITINHLAIVPKARGGDQLRVGDASAIHWGVAPIYDETNEEDMANDQLRSVIVDGLSVSTTDQGAQAITKLTDERNAARKELSDAQASHTAALADKDKEIGRLTAELQQAKDAAPKAEDIDKLVAERADLVATVHAVDKSIDITGKSNADLRRAACAKKFGDAAVKDKSDAVVEGMFLAIDIKKPDPVRDALGQRPGASDASTPPANTQAAYEQRMRDAWKPSN